MSLLSTPTRPSPTQPLRAPAESARRCTRPNPSIGLPVAVLALILAALFLLHRQVPDIAGLGLFLDTAIGWFGLAIPVLGLLAIVSRYRAAIVSVAVPTVVWALLFGPGLVPLQWTAPAVATGEASTLTVASQNIEASSGTGIASATTLSATGADVIALEEMTSDDFEGISSTLAADYPYSYGVGTVGLWSKFPVRNAQPLNLGLGWNRALAADLETPRGLVSIYVIHAASARPGEVSARDSMLSALAETLPRDENERIVAVGDFNAASTDRAMTGITSELTEANQTGGLVGGTWPSALPVTRLDHVLERGMQVTSNTTLTAGASDHRAILATMNL